MADEIANGEKLGSIRYKLNKIIKAIGGIPESGLGTAAFEDVRSFLGRDQNFADVPNVQLARENLGLGSAAEADAGDFLQPATGVYRIATFAAAPTASIPATVSRVFIEDRNAHFKDVGSSEPSHALKFPNAGRWWGIDEPVITDVMAGCVGDGEADDTAALIDWIKAVAATSGVGAAARLCTWRHTDRLYLGAAAIGALDIDFKGSTALLDYETGNQPPIFVYGRLGAGATFRNLQTDFLHLPYTFGTLTAVGADYAEFEIDTANYPFWFATVGIFEIVEFRDTGRIDDLGPVWLAARGIFYDSGVARAVTHVGGDVYRVAMAGADAALLANMTVGRVYYMTMERNTGGWGRQFSFSGPDNVGDLVFDNVVSYAGCGSWCYITDFSGDVKLINGSGTRVRRGRQVSVTGDGLHAHGVRGSISLHGARFEGNCDDGINIISQYRTLTAVDGDRIFRIAETESVDIRPGDLLYLFNADGEKAWVGYCVSYYLNAGQRVIEVDEDIPVGVSATWRVSNPSREATLETQFSTFRRLHSRLIVSSAPRTLIANNVFQNASQGIAGGNFYAATGFQEGGYVEWFRCVDNVLDHTMEFVGQLRAAIQFAKRNQANSNWSPAGSMGRCEIARNTIYGAHGNGVLVSSCDVAKVIDNLTLDYTGTDYEAETGRAAYRIHNVTQVIEDNRAKGGPSGYETVAVEGADSVEVADAKPGGRRNAFINPFFDVAQAYSGLFPLNSTGRTPIDMVKWSYATGGSWTGELIGFSDGQANVPGNPRRFLRVAQGTKPSSNFAALEFVLGDVRDLSAKRVAFRLYGRVPSGSVVLRLRFVQYFGSGGSSPVYASYRRFTLDTSWRPMDISLMLASIAGKTIGAGSYLAAQVVADVDGGDFFGDFAAVQVEEGFAPGPVNPITIAEAEALCRRYYERVAVRAINGTIWVPCAPKRATPAISQSGGTSVANATVNGCQLTHSGDAAATVIFDARL